MLNKDIIIKLISTDDQVADVFTIGLGLNRFLYLQVDSISLWGAVRDNIVVGPSDSPYHNYDTQAKSNQNLLEPNQISLNTTSVDISSTR